MNQETLLPAAAKLTFRENITLLVSFQIIAPLRNGYLNKSLGA